MKAWGEEGFVSTVCIVYSIAKTFMRVEQYPLCRKLSQREGKNALSSRTIEAAGTREQIPLSVIFYSMPACL